MNTNHLQGNIPKEFKGIGDNPIIYPNPTDIDVPVDPNTALNALKKMIKETGIKGSIDGNIPNFQSFQDEMHVASSPSQSIIELKKFNKEAE